MGENQVLLGISEEQGQTKLLNFLLHPFKEQDGKEPFVSLPNTHELLYVKEKKSAKCAGKWLTDQVGQNYLFTNPTARAVVPVSPRLPCCRRVLINSSLKDVSTHGVYK